MGGQDWISDSVVLVDSIINDVYVRIYTSSNVVLVELQFSKDGKALARRPGYEV